MAQSISGRAFPISAGPTSPGAAAGRWSRAPTNMRRRAGCRSCARRWPLITAAIRGSSSTADQVCVTSGATEALGAAILAPIEPGDEVMLFTPGLRQLCADGPPRRRRAARGRADAAGMADRARSAGSGGQPRDPRDHLQQSAQPDRAAVRRATSSGRRRRRARRTTSSSSATRSGSMCCSTASASRRSRRCPAWRSGRSRSDRRARSSR